MSKWGTFEGRLIVELLTEDDGEDRDVRVVCPFTYVGTDVTVHVPAGFVFDGASIPRAFWRLIGSPLTGDYRRAACVHDYLCRGAGKAMGISSPEVHRIFYEAMRADGCGVIRAKAMWAAVRAFGPRW